VLRDASLRDAPQHEAGIDLRQVQKKFSTVERQGLPKEFFR
jgi:hypothetical protein